MGSFFLIKVRVTQRDPIKKNSSFTSNLHNLTNKNEKELSQHIPTHTAHHQS